MLTPEQSKDKVKTYLKEEYTVSTLRAILVVAAIVILVLAFTLRNKIALVGLVAYIVLP